LRIKEIYLDLDDVLNTLAPYVLVKLLLLDKDPKSYVWWDSRWGYSIASAARDLANKAGCCEPGSPFWSNFDREGWASVPLDPNAVWLIDTCSQLVGAENVFILTRPTQFGDCYAGKCDWVSDKLGQHWLDRLIVTGQKRLLARKDRLLIDDHQDNLTSWEFAGGEAIAYPRPWNSKKGLDPAEHVRMRLSGWFGSHIQEPYES